MSLQINILRVAQSTNSYFFVLVPCDVVSDVRAWLTDDTSTLSAMMAALEEIEPHLAYFTALSDLIRKPFDCLKLSWKVRHCLTIAEWVGQCYCEIPVVNVGCQLAVIELESQYIDVTLAQRVWVKIKHRVSGGGCHLYCWRLKSVRSAFLGDLLLWLSTASWSLLIVVIHFHRMLLLDFDHVRFGSSDWGTIVGVRRISSLFCTLTYSCWWGNFDFLFGKDACCFWLLNQSVAF